MPKFSKSSLEKLESCDERLIIIAKRVIEIVDCKVIWGHRGKLAQESLCEQGFSRVHYPFSYHNLIPSLAMDLAPYPIDWQNIKRFCYFAGIVKGIAESEGIPITWGGDWGNDFNPSNEFFFDGPHFQLDVKRTELVKLRDDALNKMNFGES